MRILFVLILLTGCASYKYQYSIAEHKNVSKIYVDGAQLGVSKVGNTEVAGILNRIDKTNCRLTLMITNFGDQFNFHIPNVYLSGINNDHQVASHTVYEPNEYMRKVRSEAALSSALLGYTYGSQTTNTTTQYSDGSYSVSTNPGVDIYKQQTLIRYGLSARNTLDQIDQSLLRSNTLFKGDEVIGDVYFQVSDKFSEVVVLDVELENGDNHEIYFVTPSHL